MTLSPSFPASVRCLSDQEQELFIPRQHTTQTPTNTTPQSPRLPRLPWPVPPALTIDTLPSSLRDPARGLRSPFDRSHSTPSTVLQNCWSSLHPDLHRLSPYPGCPRSNRILRPLPIADLLLANKPVVLHLSRRLPTYSFLHDRHLRILFYIGPPYCS